MADIGYRDLSIDAAVDRAVNAHKKLDSRKEDDRWKIYNTSHGHVAWIERAELPGGGRGVKIEVRSGGGSHTGRQAVRDEFDID